MNRNNAKLILDSILIISGNDPLVCWHSPTLTHVRVNFYRRLTSGPSRCFRGMPWAQRPQVNRPESKQQPRPPDAHPLHVTSTALQTLRIFPRTIPGLFAVPPVAPLKRCCPVECRPSCCSSLVFSPSCNLQVDWQNFLVLPKIPGSLDLQKALEAFQNHSASQKGPHFLSSPPS